MHSTPTRLAAWNRVSARKYERIDNLDRAIPATYNRAKNSTDPAEIKELKESLTQMRVALCRLKPNHPHLARYTAESI